MRGVRLFELQFIDVTGGEKKKTYFGPVYFCSGKLSFRLYVQPLDHQLICDNIRGNHI